MLQSSHWKDRTFEVPMRVGDDRANSPVRAWPGSLVVGSPIAKVWLSLVDLTAVAGVVYAALTVASSDAWQALVLLTTVALAFEEVARRAARLQLRLTVGIKRDMTSVWCVAGAVALPASQSALLVAVVMTYMWFRQHRPVGEVAARRLFSSSTAVVGTVVAGLTAHATAQALLDGPPALWRTMAIVVAMVVYTTVNRGLVSVGGLLLGMPLRDLWGSKDDNLIEAATLALGGLVAAAVAFEPWAALFVLLPMLVLQRGAVVRDLEAAAITDAKTGLLNAVAWEQLAKRELLRAGRHRVKLALLIIDIDRFKVVNDRFGHLVGDKVLAGVAKAAKDSLRGYDGLGRFGGEEFVAVLPDADERAALVIAERVRIRVNQLRIGDLVPEVSGDTSRGGVQLSVSIGVSVLNSDGAELPELLHAADQALYRAKWNGRNQVQLARRGDQLPDMVNL